MRAWAYSFPGALGFDDPMRLSHRGRCLVVVLKARLEVFFSWHHRNKCSVMLKECSVVVKKNIHSTLRLVDGGGVLVFSEHLCGLPTDGARGVQ